MTESESERRREVRVVFRATARLKFDDDRIYDNCRTSNISVSGVFVEGVVGVAVWDKCAVDFQLVGRSSSLVLALQGQVVRVQDDGVALQFDEVDEDSFCHLQNIVYYNYRREERPGETSPEPDFEFGDETLYLGLGGGKGKPLPGNYLSNGRDDDEYSEFDDELDRDILDRIGPSDDPDDDI